MTAPEDRPDSEIRADLRNSLEACRNAGESIRDELAEARALFSAIHEVDLARASAAEARLEAVKALLDCGQVVEPGCCTTCKGTGYSAGEEATGGKCWDCRSTGHPHGPVEADDLQQFLTAVRRAALSGEAS